MLPKTRILSALLVGAAMFAGSARAADFVDSLKKGTPDLQSAGALAFGPDGILFVGDSRGAAVFAFDTGDRQPNGSAPNINIEGVDGKIASLLGTDAKQILLNGLTVNPISGKAYLSVARGRGPDAAPAIVRVNSAGQAEEFSWKDAKFAKVTLPNAPGAEAKDRRGQPVRQESITQVGYIDGRVFVAGLSTEEWSSTLRSIPFPFTEADRGTGVQIYHGGHGQFETNAPVRTFTSYKIDGQTNLLAAYTCTPLVKFPVSDLKPGEKVKGTTIAELGQGNRPLDMFVYQKDGKDYILIANNARGVMKVSTENIAKIEGIDKRIKGTAGLPYETIKDIKGVQHLAPLDKERALVLIKTGEGALNLQAVPLP